MRRLILTQHGFGATEEAAIRRARDRLPFKVDENYASCDENYTSGPPTIIHTATGYNVYIDYIPSIGAIVDAVNRLPSRYGDILRYRLGLDGPAMSIEETSTRVYNNRTGETGVCRSRVREMEITARRKLAKELARR